MTENLAPASPERTASAGALDVLQSVTRNLSVMIGAQVITFTLSFIYRAALGRILLDVGYGKLTFALSVATLFSTLAGLGLFPLVTREAARSREQAGRYLSTGVLLLVLSAVPLFVAFCVVVTAIKSDPETRMLAYLVGFSSLLELFVFLHGSIFQAFERMAYVSAGVIAEKVITTALSIVLLTHGFGIVAVGWTMVLASLANLAMCVAFARRLVRVALRVRLRAIWDMLVAGLPFFVWAVFTTIYFRIDATMLSLMTTDAVTGWYGVAYALYESLGFLSSLLRAVLLPPMSRLYVTNRPQFERTCRHAFLVYSLVTAPIAFGTAALAEPIVGLIYPLSQFGNSVPVLRILGIGFIPLFYNVYLATVVIAVDRQRFWSLAAVACAFINPAMNLVLIPAFQRSMGNGGIGAAWATNAIELFLLVVGFALLPRGVLTRRDVSLALRALGCGLVMGLVVWWQSGLGLPRSIAGGAVLYVTLCFVFGVTRPSDLKELVVSLRRQDKSNAAAAY
jgi:O-antigen/teichoic acid export membrane protein